MSMKSFLKAFEVYSMASVFAENGELSTAREFLTSYEIKRAKSGKKAASFQAEQDLLAEPA